MILGLRTDKPEAELYLAEDNQVRHQATWEAHRQLASTFHKKIKTELQQVDATLQDINGIVIYEGPGSFTGLRIGMAVANALADSFGVPIVAAGGDDWLSNGMTRLSDASVGGYATPVYGSAPHITQQRK